VASRAVLAALALLAAASWACLGEIDIVATAEGRLIPASRVQKVQPREAGRVGATRADEGDRVRRGDVLVELDDVARRADRERLANNRDANLLDVARLRALAEGRADAFAPPAGADPAAAALHRAWLGAELAEHAAALGALDAAIARNAAREDGISLAIARLEATLPFLEERARARGALARRGHYARLSWLELERERVEREHELEAEVARLAEARAEAQALRQRRHGTEAGFARQARARLVEAERLSVSLAQELAKAERHLEDQRVAAPVDGTVHQRSVHTLGGFAQAGETLMLVVPEDSRLELEALVPVRDAGFLAAGQEARLKLDPFPFTIHGTLPGRVREVARDAIDDPRLGPSYPVRIALQATRLSAGGQDVALSPGMRASADIVTGRRSLGAILLSPLARLADEALRER
jgi:hemolysin D